MNLFSRFLEWIGISSSPILALRRYLRFGLVGTSGVAVDMAVLFILADPWMLGLNLSLSKVLAAEIAIVGNFTLNELWTFRDLAVDNSWAAGWAMTWTATSAASSSSTDSTSGAR